MQIVSPKLLWELSPFNRVPNSTVLYCPVSSQVQLTLFCLYVYVVFVVLYVLLAPRGRFEQ
jgi:hypothetical protein